jgi:hypothetical protein
MIKIHGPSYRYSGEQLSTPELIYIEDHLYDEDSQCFPIKQLLATSTCDPAQHVLVFDHVNQQDDFEQYNCVYLPELLNREAEHFFRGQIVPDWTNKTRAFNFMINKSRPHRQMLLRIIDQYQLTNFSHSLCWKQSTVPGIPVTDYRIGDEIQLDRGVKNGHYPNALTYRTVLQQQVFEPSCISLITEPVYVEQQTIVTEKTIMAMYGGTIPIWVGGWRIADWMTSQGFEVFDDVVDHSYQQLSDPRERVQQAIRLNIDLLRAPDPGFLKKYRDRLWHNYILIHSNPFRDQCQAICNSLGIWTDSHTDWLA